MTCLLRSSTTSCRLGKGLRTGPSADAVAAFSGTDGDYLKSQSERGCLMGSLEL